MNTTTTSECINLNTWPRSELFRFYIDEMRIVMSLTVDIDITPLRCFVKAHGLKFYPTMIWVVATIINAHDEFKYGWDDAGNLIKWTSVSPSYAHFHKTDERFTKMVTPFTADLFDFHARFLHDRARCDSLRGIVGHQPPNFFDVTCLPWVHYRHFDLHVFDEGRFLAPVVSWGKFDNEGGRSVMPMTMNIHYAVADGYHLSRFFTEVQMMIDTLHA